MFAALAIAISRLLIESEESRDAPSLELPCRAWGVIWRMRVKELSSRFFAIAPALHREKKRERERKREKERESEEKIAEWALRVSTCARRTRSFGYLPTHTEIWR